MPQAELGLLLLCYTIDWLLPSGERDPSFLNPAPDSTGHHPPRLGCARDGAAAKGTKRDRVPPPLPSRNGDGAEAGRDGYPMQEQGHLGLGLAWHGEEPVPPEELLCRVQTCKDF